ncbi:MAG TPA: aminotransferase class III-fold pyridoxal phosphate-dependent enzyme [Armatimonadota bacterium]|nr:aminotransferase class III-fold pyridoxal phosphate-dependent enzyme [Armatimonadota bacterium]HQK94264.1 aminotransferase class III-fold pyridoxal phosphate-dependent enzyme [Armatimonadota bacterium]
MSCGSEYDSWHRGGLLGPNGREVFRAIAAAGEYLMSRTPSELLEHVGRTVDAVPAVTHLDKNVIQASYGGRRESIPNDMLSGRGLFFITEQRRLMLDCTAGHYQMTWGYRHPVLDAAVREALDAGIVPDDHSNIPGAPVKRLAYKLAELCNPDDAGLPQCDDSGVRDNDASLNTVLLGIVTGSVACSTALKVMLARHRAQKGTRPAIVTLEGNYHGTDMFAQRMRHMWADYFTDFDFVNVEPNDLAGLEDAFDGLGERVMGVMLEPVMMNREAILVEPDFAQRIRELCDRVDALMAVDEIQTGFWCPEVFHYKRWGVVPDFVICGKGMTAGVHPLSAVIFRRPLDILAQYDSISTNGGAPLAAHAALHSIALIEAEAERIDRVAQGMEAMMRGLVAQFPDVLKSYQGDGFLSGLKFHRVEHALEFHRRCIERGLWVRVHAYHEGHSTILTKFALLLDDPVIEFVRQAFAELLRGL